MNQPFNQFLRTWYILGMAIIISMILFCCKKDNKSNSGDEYYIKYIVSSSSQNWANKITVTLRNDKNENLSYTIDEDTRAETIIGPVAKGFNAFISAKVNSANYQLVLNAQIEVSKNSSPFALKAIDDSNTKRNQVDLGYSIDF